MKIRQVLAVVAIPFVIGTFNFVSPNKANAEVPPHENQQIAQQPQQQARPNEKPQLKHRQPRPQQKKRVNQPRPQQLERNQVRPDNR
jgi:hypothetical protein